MKTFMQRRAVPAAILLGAAVLWLSSGTHVSTQSRVGGRRTVMVNGHEAVAGEVLVRFKPSVSAVDRTQLETQLDTEESASPAPGLRRIRSRSFDTNTLISYMRTRGDVEMVEPNYVLYALALPNEPSFANLWGLRNLGQTVNGDVGTSGKDISASLAWDITTGSRANVVGVIDTGVNYTHPDLAANIWTAPRQFSVVINGVTITCAAGTHGFNAITNTCDPMDDNAHGTHVSGTIGGVGNNGAGMAGVNWTASIMGLKFLSATGSGSTSDAIEAIEFAIQAKAALGVDANVRVLSNSWGGGGATQALLDEINKANTANMIFLAAAGNSAVNIDTTPFYPAAYNAPNVVSVAATDNDDNIASFSNYGVTNVDLAAPGVNIYSTVLGTGYAWYNGTSMATPHVSGAAALILAACPTLTTAQLKSSLLSSVDAVPALATRVATGGRLNVNRAVRACATPPTVPAAPTSLTATAGNARVTLAWPAVTGAASYKVLRGTVIGTYAQIAAGVTTTGYVDTAVSTGRTYHYVVVATNSAGDSPRSPNASATPYGVPTVPTGVSATAGATGTRRITVAWTASPGATSYTIRRRTTATGTLSTIGTTSATSLTNINLSAGRTYYYVVSASNTYGTSANSAQVSAVAR